MPTYNAEQYVSQAIESTLKQSFSDFEFIIIDDGSTDNTRSIINSYDDSRIKLVENNHDFIGSLNMGLDLARGKYIARMDADDIMNIDRLNIQYSLMEAKSDIDICSSWMQPFGENIPRGAVSRSLSGKIDNPLLQLLQACIFFHPTIMMKTEFIRKNKLEYQKNFIYAEDYKLWIDAAKCNGVFYIEPQPLLYYRVSESQVSNVRNIEQTEASNRIKSEVLDLLLKLNSEKYDILCGLETTMRDVVLQGLMKDNDIFSFFHTLFLKNFTIMNLSNKF